MDSILAQSRFSVTYPYMPMNQYISKMYTIHILVYMWCQMLFIFFVIIYSGHRKDKTIVLYY